MDATEGSENRFDGQTLALETRETTDDVAKNSKHGKKVCSQKAVLTQLCLFDFFQLAEKKGVCKTFLALLIFTSTNVCSK